MRYMLVFLLSALLTTVSGAQAPADTVQRSPIIIKLVDSLSRKDSTTRVSAENSHSELVRLNRSQALGPSRNSARAGVGRQGTYLAVPKDALIEKYPIIGESVSQGEIEERFGLHLDTLRTPWTGLNWFRNVGRFAYDSLSVGTIVYTDADGNPRYKADCNNRLVELPAIVDAMISTNTDSVDKLPDWVKEILEKGITVNLEVPDEFYTALSERRVDHVERSWWKDNDQWVIPTIAATVVTMVIFKPFSNKNVVKIGY
ncbi:MAG: hypothetical protein ACYCY6_00370 [Minisyncoccota bacterium]